MPKLVNGEVRMDFVEMFAVFMRKRVFDDSWEKHLEWLNKFGTPMQKQDDIPLVLGLKKFEEENHINLFDFLTAEWKNFQLPEKIKDDFEKGEDKDNI